MPITIFTTFFLSFTHWIVVIPVLLAGLFINHKLFYKLVCLLLLSILVNVALKSIFQVPLNPAIGKAGFAFPSGHMQLAVVLYGWIFWHFKSSLLRLPCLVILAGVGFSLIYCGYHDLKDVLGALVTGSVLIVMFSRYLQEFPLRLLCVSLLLMGFNLLCYHPLPGYALNAGLVLMSLIFFEKCLKSFRFHVMMKHQ